MKDSNPSRTPRAFTLIELLVVIAVIGVLAGMIIPVGLAVGRAKVRSKAFAELSQVEIAIAEYKDKLGHYPPDNTNTNRSYLNQLYYELVGTAVTNQVYTTVDSVSRIPATDATLDFGVDGFVNTSKGGGGDEVQNAQNFFKALKTTYYLYVTDTSIPKPCTVLGTMLPGPLVLTNSTQKINPWRYVSSNPTNNPNSYDLWIDVVIGQQVKRVCNWSKVPL